MSGIVNLRSVRKRKQRAESEAQAAANRVRFGRTKGERLGQEAEAGRADRVLDGARLGHGSIASGGTQDGPMGESVGIAPPRPGRDRP